MQRHRENAHKSCKREGPDHNCLEGGGAGEADWGCTPDIEQGDYRARYLKTAYHTKDASNASNPRASRHGQMTALQRL
jgi:hypothetical protein